MVRLPVSFGPKKFKEPRNFGYDIALVPHSERDRIRLKRQAKRKGMSLADFARDEILGLITLGFREEATPHEHENRS